MAGFCAAPTTSPVPLVGWHWPGLSGPSMSAAAVSNTMPPAKVWPRSRTNYWRDARAGWRQRVTRLQGYKGLTARDVFSAYDRGDPVAKEVLVQAIECWGMTVANLVSLFNPEMIIFGGGVFGPAAQFLGDIYAEAQKWAHPISIKQVKLQASKLGGDAGLYGAGCLALQAQSGAC